LKVKNPLAGTLRTMGNVEATEPGLDIARVHRPPRASESPRTNSRGALIDAALEEFSTKGYEVATLGAGDGTHEYLLTRGSHYARMWQSAEGEPVAAAS
jgi:hypothetical protein